jgi:hypothetical protein
MSYSFILEKSKTAVILTAVFEGGGYNIFWI